MKKLIAAVLAVICVAASLVGCGYEDALQGSSSANSTQSTTTADEKNEKKVSADDYADSFDGLCDYFKDMGYIVEKAGDKIDEKNVVEMDYKLVGAEKGKKFATKYNGNSVLVELYSFNTEKLTSEAKAVIDSVKKDGTFTILDLNPVKAYLSDNGKYLMIYTDNSINDENPDTKSDSYTHREEVIENFKAFHK